MKAYDFKFKDGEVLNAIPLATTMFTVLVRKENKCFLVSRDSLQDDSRYALKGYHKTQ